MTDKQTEIVNQATEWSDALHEISERIRKLRSRIPNQHIATAGFVDRLLDSASHSINLIRWTDLRQIAEDNQGD